MIELRSLSCGYGDTAVLNDVGATADPGQMTCILGVNASGKSTLLKTAAGVLKPTAGQVLLNGDDLHQMEPKAVARQVAYIPQFTEPVFEVKVQDLVAVGRYSWISGLVESQEDREAVEEAMRLAGCSELADRDFRTLSGGERQRCSLARGLAQGAKTMLLDEPMAHLDLRHRYVFEEVLCGLRDRGYSLIVAVHELHPLLARADQVWVLGDGTLVWSGVPDELEGNSIVEDALGVGIARGNAGSIAPVPR